MSLDLFSYENLQGKTLKELIPVRDDLLWEISEWLKGSDFEVFPIKKENLSNGMVVHRVGNKRTECEIFVQNGKKFGCTIRICTNEWTSVLHEIIDDAEREVFHAGWVQKTEFFLHIYELESFLERLSGEKSEHDETFAIRKTEALSDEEIKKHADSLDMYSLKVIAANQSTVKPKEATVSIKQIQRNVYIAEYARRRAGGICQLCGNKAPFNRADGEPYLESHHIVWLSEGGADSIDNTVALCPNCHRKMHVVKDPMDIEVLKAKAKNVD